MCSLQPLISTHIAIRISRVCYSFCIIIGASAYTVAGGSGPILLDSVGCSGNELSLVSCPHADFEVHDCTHAQDAAVTCLGKLCKY